MNPVRGILLKLVAIFIFVVMSSLVKATSDHVPPGQAVFFRSFFAIPVILVWLLLRRELHIGLRVKRPMGHVWRGVIGTTAMSMMFAALGLLPLPEVTAIGFAVPLFLTLFAAVFLGETIRAFRIAALGIGLIGVVIIIWPRLTLDLNDDANSLAAFGAALALFSAMMAALAQMHIRKLVQTEQISAVAFYFSVTAACLSLLTIPFGWVWPSPAETVMLITAGLIGGVGQICLTAAYRFAPASTVAPFDYVSMLFALAIGYFIFAEVPTLPMLAGAALVIASGILIIWRERQLGLKRGKAKPGMTPQG